MMSICITITMYMHIAYAMHVLSSMIENTWRWASENNKIIKHPISGGEFVEIDLESLSRKVHTEGAEMTQVSGGVYQVLMHAVRYFHLIHAVYF